MTGGQSQLSLDDETEEAGEGAQQGIVRLSDDRPALKIVRAGAEELAAHSSRLEAIEKASEGKCVWLHELQTVP